MTPDRRSGGSCPLSGGRGSARGYGTKASIPTPQRKVLPEAADPVAYMAQRASILRSGDLDEEQARLLKQKNRRLRASLSDLLHFSAASGTCSLAVKALFGWAAHTLLTLAPPIRGARVVSTKDRHEATNASCYLRSAEQ